MPSAERGAVSWSSLMYWRIQSASRHIRSASPSPLRYCWYWSRPPSPFEPCLLISILSSGVPVSLQNSLTMLTISEFDSQARIVSLSPSSLSSVASVLLSSVLLDSSVLLESVVEDPVELVALLLEQPATAPRIDADANTAAKILFFIGNSSRSIRFCVI